MAKQNFPLPKASILAEEENSPAASWLLTGAESTSHMDVRIPTTCAQEGTLDFRATVARAKKEHGGAGLQILGREEGAIRFLNSLSSPPL